VASSNHGTSAFNVSTSIVDCSFSNNTSVNGDGGAVFTFQLQDIPANYLYDQCSSTTTAGRVFREWFYERHIHILGSSFVNNTCRSAGANGGAVAILGGGGVVVERCQLDSNVATSAGCVVVLSRRRCDVALMCSCGAPVQRWRSRGRGVGVAAHRELSA
jgi:hypothetical protein